MGELQKLQQLSADHCVLLAVVYATDSNIKALRALTALRNTDFDLELALRILLTHLPESADPSTYVELLDALVNSAPAPSHDPAACLDVSSVESLSNTQARKKRRKLELLPLVYPLYKAESELDPLTHFLIHRAHLIDAETGLLDLLPHLLVPFLNHSEYLRTWFISTVLPLLRLGYEYYPEKQTLSLAEFARLNGRRAIEVQLSNLHTEQEHVARDLRSVVSPWMCGANERKRRKLSFEGRRASITQLSTPEPDDWECLFEWLLNTSKTNLALVSTAITEWDGPDDTDLGGYEEGRRYVDEETQRKIELRYAQIALACIYLISGSSDETLRTAHGLLTRICHLLTVEPPPDLHVEVAGLPAYNPSTAVLQAASPSSLQEEQIVRPDNPLTKPDGNAVRLLDLVLFSTHLLSSLEHPMPIREVTRMYLRGDSAEETSLLQKIVHALSAGSKKDSERWKTIRSKLLWLWNWGTPQTVGDRYAQGIFGNIDKKTIETEILKGLLETGQYPLAVNLYVRETPDHHPLPLPVVEKVVLTTAMHHYDNASNGNRARGGMKRASDIISAFNDHFPDSNRFRRIQALLSATHAMSFYSLTLQHGVPFQPVNIRVSADPLSLVKKLLSQNSRSYTHLDNLISIGQNLVIAMPSTLMDDDADPSNKDPSFLEKKKAAAERRVIGMTVEAALKEDDFETAYSYVINRLTPHTPSPTSSPAASASSHRFSFGSHDSVREDEPSTSEDVAWRAALLAGRHPGLPSPSSSLSWPQSQTATSAPLRRLEQRMELLSQALLLAPPAHLEEVLAEWTQCEAQLNALMAQENDAELRFNDAADHRVPGAFAAESVAVQPRREVGRGAVEEAPMGLFDVARGAAAAFSKTAFPLRGSASGASGVGETQAGRVSMDASDDGSGRESQEERVRRRDVVANAVTGGLASGIGWVLGATPVDRNRE